MSDVADRQISQHTAIAITMLAWVCVVWQNLANIRRGKHYLTWWEVDEFLLWLHGAIQVVQVNQC